MQGRAVCRNIFTSCKVYIYFESSTAGGGDENFNGRWQWIDPNRNMNEKEGLDIAGTEH